MPITKTAAAAPAKLADTIGPRPETADRFNHRAELLERILTHPLLPTPPTLALQIVERTRQADCKLEEIGEMLAQDPALCGRLLKTLNSSLYGLSRPVTSLGRAVTMLGLKPLRSLVLGLTMSSMHMRQEPDDGLRRYWRDSVAGAIITREFARRIKYPSPEEDMVASLLRDLGMLLLRQSFPILYQPVWSRGSVISHARQCDWEEQHLGINHAEVSAALLEQWRLPGEIVEPIRFHHLPGLLPPESSSFAGRTHLLDFTSRLAHLEGASAEFEAANPGEGGEKHPAISDGDIQHILHAAQSRYGLDRAGLEEFLAEVGPKIEEFAAVLNLDIGACPDFGEILAAGCDELIQSSMEGATRVLSESALLHDQIATHLDRPRPERSDSAPCDVSEADSCEEFFAKLTQSGANPRIQQYEIQEMIGHGAMGIVIRAHDVALDRDVALKFLVPGLVQSRKAHERFALEARFAAAIRQENVVTIFAVSEYNGLPFLVMEYIAGKSLQDYLDAGTNFTVAEVACMGRQTARGLSAAHELRLIHRDIKPANLLLEEAAPSQRRVRITDFGLARAMDSDYDISQQGVLVGTPIFMSPEQVDGKPLTPASDLFSLGSVLYTLCTGQLPFNYDSFTALLHAVAEKKAPPVRELNGDIPDWMAELIENLHHKDPTARFGPASAVAAYLDRHLPR